MSFFDLNWPRFRSLAESIGHMGVSKNNGTLKSSILIGFPL